MDGMILNEMMQKITSYGCIGIDMDGQVLKICAQPPFLIYRQKGSATASRLSPFSKYRLCVTRDLKFRGIQQILIF
jgi:hypothetical protein